MNYIGITGFMNRNEVNDIMSVWEEIGRLFMIGVLVSWKTLNGETANNPRRYPNLSKVKDIFIKDSRVLNLVHYNTRQKDTLRDQLCKIIDHTDGLCQGFQLNMVFPPVDQLRKFKTEFPDLEIVFQVNRGVFKKTKFSPQKLVELLEYDYGDMVDHVLLDASGGRGTIININEIKRYIEPLNRYKVGIAGGLSPETVDNIKPLVGGFSRISIDAESGVRDKNDDLDTKRAKKYIQRSLDIFRRSD